MARRSLLSAILALGLLQGLTAIAGVICASPGTVLLDTAGDLHVAYTALGQPVELPAPGSPGWRTWVGRQLDRSPAAPGWIVERTATDQDITIRIINRQENQVAVEQSFEKRIELAASAVAPGGTYALYLQGNNIASELWILDGPKRSAQTVYLQHDADLAPFAIGFAFSPSQGCVVVSLERVGGPGLEAWIVDLATGDARRLNVGGLIVERWVRISG